MLYFNGPNNLIGEKTSIYFLKKINISPLLLPDFILFANGLLSSGVPENVNFTTNGS